MLFAAEHINVVRAERIVSGDREPDRAANAAKFLDDRDVFDITHAGTAVLFGKNNAEKPELGELGSQFLREMLGLVPFHDMRPDLALGKFTDTVFYLQLLFGEFKVHNLRDITSDYVRIRFGFEANHDIGGVAIASRR